MTAAAPVLSKTPPPGTPPPTSPRPAPTGPRPEPTHPTPQGPPKNRGTEHGAPRPPAGPGGPGPAPTGPGRTAPAATYRPQPGDPRPTPTPFPTPVPAPAPDGTLNTLPGSTLPPQAPQPGRAYVQRVGACAGYLPPGAPAEGSGRRAGAATSYRLTVLAAAAAVVVGCASAAAWSARPDVVVPATLAGLWVWLSTIATPKSLWPKAGAR